MQIHLATDHAGYELKEAVKAHLEDAGYEVTDHGAHEFDKGDDYPDFIHPAAQAAADEPDNARAIIFGHSGQGEAMVANRYKNVRAAVCYGGDVTEQIVRLSRKHNDANVLSLGAGFIENQQALAAVDLWLGTEFSEAERHMRRIEKIEKLNHG